MHEVIKVKPLRKQNAEYKRWWFKKHPDCWKRWPSTYDGRSKLYKQAWKNRNRDKVRKDNKMRARRRSREVSLTYIRNHWTNKWGLKNVPDSLLAIAAELIKLQRLIKLKRTKYGT